MYLTHERNLAATSEAMDMHRTSLVYRFKKINTLIGEDFDDYRERMYLILSYEFKSNVRETWCVILVSESWHILLRITAHPRGAFISVGDWTPTEKDLLLLTTCRSGSLNSDWDEPSHCINTGLQPEVAQSLTLIGRHFPMILYTEIRQIQECFGILAARCASCSCMTYFYCPPLQSCRRLYQLRDWLPADTSHTMYFAFPESHTTSAGFCIESSFFPDGGSLWH